MLEFDRIRLGKVLDDSNATGSTGYVDRVSIGQLARIISLSERWIWNLFHHSVVEQVSLFYLKLCGLTKRSVSDTGDLLYLVSLLLKYNIHYASLSWRRDKLTIIIYSQSESTMS